MSDNEIENKEAEPAIEAEASKEQAEQVEQTEQSVSPEEQDARNKGWTDRAEWEAAGKNPDDWVNHKHFNRVGSLISEVRNGNRQHKGDIENLQAFQKLQLESMKASLESERKEAVSMADEDAFSAADRQLNGVNQQLNELSAQQEVSTNTLIAQETEWMERNPSLINEQRATIDRVMAEYPSVRGYELTDLIERTISKISAPAVNANRERPSPTSKSKPAPQKAEAVTLDSMNKQESQLIAAMRNQNPNLKDAEVIRMLKNVRG